MALGFPNELFQSIEVDINYLRLPLFHDHRKQYLASSDFLVVHDRRPIGLHSCISFNSQMFKELNQIYSHRGTSEAERFSECKFLNEAESDCSAVTDLVFQFDGMPNS